jgi:hypothetical protein
MGWMHFLCRHILCRHSHTLQQHTTGVCTSLCRTCECARRLIVMHACEKGSIHMHQPVCLNWVLLLHPPASSGFGSSPSTSLPHEGQSLVCDIHDRQKVCWQLVTLCASNSSPLHTGQCRVVSLGPRAVPKPRGQTAGACSGAVSGAAVSLDAKGHIETLLGSFRAAAANGHPALSMLLSTAIADCAWWTGCCKMRWQKRTIVVRTR